MSGPYKDLNRGVNVSSFEDVDLSLTYSYAQYLTWLFDDRVEIIKGKVFKMSAPSRYHQLILGNIFYSLYHYLKNKPCRVYVAPFDVRFPKDSKADKDIYTVLQPDLCVICDHSKLDERGCIGAPDIVIEILSPGNSRKDLVNKYRVYEEFGVKEYLIVDPVKKTLKQFTLGENGKYIAPQNFTLGVNVRSKVLPGFELDLEEVFKD